MPILPPAAKLAIVAAVFRVEPLLVNCAPLTTRFPFKVLTPVTVKVPPRLVAPVPTVKVDAPETAKFPVKVLAPASV